MKGEDTEVLSQWLLSVSTSQKLQLQEDLLIPTV